MNKNNESLEFYSNNIKNSIMKEKKIRNRISF